MTKTENYQLNQWEPADPIRRTDFNADNAAIDAALSESAMALTDYQTANDAAVAKKAEQSAVTALEQSVNSQITALAEALGSGGKTCRIAWGSYTGNGKYGSSNPNTLTFPFQPRLVFITTGGMESFSSCILAYPIPYGTSTYFGASLVVTWGTKTVSWYTTATSNQSQSQNNTSGYVYYYFAFGGAE